MAEENLGEIYVKIKADVSGLEKELADLKRKIDKESKENQTKLDFKAKFDTSIAKLRLSELQSYRQKLQKEFDKKVSLNVDAASLDRTRLKIASVDNQLKDVGKTAQSFGSKLLGGLAAFGGITAFFKIIRDSIDAAKESAIAQAQISKAVETTGQSAGFTAKQLFKMAEELQKLNAIDDDKILTDITNNLLTFKNVSGDAFKRAQQAILDLNAVISKGELGALTSQTIQLGKALNAPTEGVTALTRVGVSFTEQQKEQIKALEKSGKLFEAQSIILTEIEGQYGGQAEALAKATGGMQQFSVTVGTLLEKLGAPLLTVLGKVATSISALLDPIESVNEGFIEQKKNLDDLQKSVTPLLTRYDELKSKTSLNKTEQDELRTIILRVAGAIPSAISALDDYGVATDINRAKVEEFIKTEQKRLAVVNKNDIDAFNKKKNLAEQSKKLLEEELKRSLESGKKTVQFSTAQGIIEREVKISDKDITDAQQKIKAFQYEIDGYNAQLDLLSGKVDEVKPIDSGKTVPDTTAGDEVLKQYQEQQQAIEQIRNKLKDVNLTTAERIELQKALDGLLNKEVKKPKEYTPKDIKPYYLGYDKDSLEREKRYIEEGLSINKLKRGELVLNMQETNQVMLDNSMFTTEAIFQDWIDKNRSIQDTLQVSRDVIGRAFDEIRIRASSNASAIENMFVDMGNIILNKFKEIAAEWAAMAFLRFIFGVATGGAAAAVPVGHSGGNFIGTSSGVKKMAGGGSFIVPPGFPNDSYPLLVESGERVTVNPTSQTGMESRLLKSIDRKLAVLNSNTLEGQMRKSDPKAIPLYGRIENDAIYLSNKRASKLIGRMG